MKENTSQQLAFIGGKSRHLRPLHGSRHAAQRSHASHMRSAESKSIKWVHSNRSLAWDPNAPTEDAVKVTKQMLDAAMRKAVEAGLLPREALRQESYADREIIRLVVEAAIESANDAYLEPASRPTYSSWRRLVRTRVNGAI